MTIVQTGIARLRDNKELSDRYTGNIGVLCHSASIDENYTHTIETMIKIFGSRLKKIFGPQHGFVTDVQDNMVETNHFTHPFFKIPIYSLYSETRVPTDEMLSGLDHLFIDLQDVGCRIYTYIYTMTHILEKCAGLDIQVIILDRPNPINATDVEGNVLDQKFASFVGRHPLPVRHGLTIGEVALMHQKFWAKEQCNLEVLKMKGYNREMGFSQTDLPYVNPSPNLPTIDGCYTFAGTVLFEGTNISEGRGTTRSLEVIGYPAFDPWEYQAHFNKIFTEVNLLGFKLRPLNFYPMFQKHKEKSCGGFHIHITNKELFKPWRVSQIILKELIQILGDKFSYKTDAYEYGEEMMAIDMINGDDRFKDWYARPADYAFLDAIENEKMPEYLANRLSISIYK